MAVTTPIPLILAGQQLTIDMFIDAVTGQARGRGYIETVDVDSEPLFDGYIIERSCDGVLSVFEYRDGVLIASSLDAAS